MRLFVCSHLTPGLQERYRRGLQPILNGHRDVLRAIPAGSAHLTHTFVGRYAASSVDPLVEALRPVVRDQRPLPVTFGAPVVLFGGSEARLLCAPVASGTEAVAALSVRVFAAVRALPDVHDASGSKSPHVTLARFRRNTRRAAARPVVEALLGAVLRDQREMVDRLQIVSSQLMPDGPVYTVLHELEFGGDAE